MSRIVGVIIGNIDPKIANVLTYLIAFQNTIQKSFQFRIFSASANDPFIQSLSVENKYTHESIIGEMRLFLSRFNEGNRIAADEYNLEHPVVDQVVLLTTARLIDDYFLVGVNNWTVLALGKWDKELFPPTIVEYFLSFLVRAILDKALLRTESHFDTRGCVSDFCANLSDARASVLAGDICSDCASTAKSDIEKTIVEDGKILIRRTWLGTQSNPSDVALTVKKMGYDLFHTAGIKPTLWQRLRLSLEEEGLKTVVKITFTALAAGAALVGSYFGIISLRSLFISLFS